MPARRVEVGPRPKCPDHPNNRVWIGGRSRRWSAFHEREFFFCVDRFDRKIKHRIPSDTTGRHPAEHNPSGAERCPHCEHVLSPIEGPQVGSDYLFTFREQAVLLVQVGKGVTFRDASESIRKRAWRYARPKAMRLPQKARRNYTGRKEPWRTAISDQPALAMAYVDAYAPILAAALLPDRWPEVIAIDSKPYKKKALVEDPKRRGTGVYHSGGHEYSEIMAAVDHTDPEGSKVFALHLEGGKDQASWESFFQSREGQPRLVIADQDAGLEAAVEKVWPDAILYNCHVHLLMNAHEYLVKDGIPLKVVKERVGEPSDETIVWKTHPLHVLLMHALKSPAQWEDFKAGVAKDVDATRKQGIRQWIRSTEPLILDQFEIRALYPDMTVSNGAAETAITQMNGRIGDRISVFKNAARLQKVLALMTIEMRDDPGEAEYAKILTDHFASKGGRPAPKWAASRIGVGRAPTIDGVVTYATHRNAILRRTHLNETERKRSTRRHLEIDEALAAKGLSRTRGGITRRRDGKPSTTYYPIQGRKVTDYTTPQDLAGEWDYERNEGLDPTKISGGNPTRVWWICRAHADGPGSHLHRWEAAISQRAAQQSGCPYCMNRQACQWNSLGSTRTDIAAEWAVEANGDLTPFDVLAGSSRRVFWLCDRDPSHPPYQARVQQRTSQGSHCPKAHPVQSAERARRTDAARQRRHHALALRALPAAPDLGIGSVLSGTSMVEDSPDGDFTWDPTAPVEPEA